MGLAAYNREKVESDKEIESYLVEHMTDHQNHFQDELIDDYFDLSEEITRD